ncbi:MAG: DNA repair protein RecO [Patescibacteria group bacterium]|nr:DNA repair protein RecO [Patescibacteria group bacterium]
MSRYLTTSAITLRTQSRGENDRVYTLYTGRTGLVEAVADGSQKVCSKLAGHLEPFGEVMVTLVRRGAGYKLSGAIARQRFRRINDSGEAMAAAGACLQFTRRMMITGHPEAETYALLRDALAQLNTPASKFAVSAAPTVYALKLLAQMGFQPQLDRCGRCRAAIHDGSFDVVAGSLRCPRCQKKNTGQYIAVDAVAVAYLRMALALPLAGVLHVAVAGPTLAVARELVARFAEYHTEVARAAAGPAVVLS